VLFKEGDPIDGVYIIISGEYEYFKNVGDPDFDKTSSKWVEFAIKSNIKGDINNTSKRSIAIIQSGEIIGFEEIYENFYS
jgi:CRP-like cAMP-binding protein